MASDVVKVEGEVAGHPRLFKRGQGVRVRR